MSKILLDFLSSGAKLILSFLLSKKGCCFLGALALVHSVSVPAVGGVHRALVGLGRPEKRKGRLALSALSYFH